MPKFCVINSILYNRADKGIDPMRLISLIK